MSEPRSLQETLPRLIALAAQNLRWQPDTFWSATPDDLHLAFGSGEPAAEGLTRADLDRLMRDQSDG